MLPARVGARFRPRGPAEACSQAHASRDVGGVRFLDICRTPAHIVAAVLLASSAGSLDAQSTTPAHAPDTLVVECRIGDVAARVLEARMVGDTIFLPTARVLALAGLDSAAAPGDRSLQSISTLLHAEVSFDSSALVVQVADSGTLPVSRRAARSRMRERLHDRVLASSTVAVVARVPAAPSALTMSYSAQRDGAFAVDAVSRTFGGALDGALVHAPRAAMRATLAWTGIPDATGGGMRIRLGAIDELEGAAGVLLTNVPLIRDDTLRVLPLTALAAPGTELELLEDDELVAADSVSDASPSLLLHPQRYGTHVVRLVSHDANGIEHESRWIESTPDALLPRGTFRYSAAVGRCTWRACSTFAARAALAPTDRITLSLGMTPARASPGAHELPTTLHAALDVRIAEASVLSVRREGTEPPATELRVERGAGRSFALRTGAANDSPASALAPSLLNTGHRIASASGSWLLPAHAALDAAAALSRSTVASAMTTSIPLRVGVMQGSILTSRDGTGTCLGWTFGALVHGAWIFRAIGRVRSALLRLREERRVLPCGAATHSVLVALPTGATSALELSASWERARRPVLSVALRRRIGSILTAHAELTGDDRSYAARSDVAGTIVLDALRRSISLSVDPGASTATVEGFVYVDENANGRRDAGEAVVPDAAVRSGDASAVSDTRGIFVLPNLAADRLARLSVDSLSVEDAGVVPIAPVSVVLTPRTVVRVDVALRRQERTP